MTEGTSEQKIMTTYYVEIINISNMLLSDVIDNQRVRHLLCIWFYFDIEPSFLCTQQLYWIDT